MACYSVVASFIYYLSLYSDSPCIKCIKCNMTDCIDFHCLFCPVPLVLQISAEELLVTGLFELHPVWLRKLQCASSSGEIPAPEGIFLPKVCVSSRQNLTPGEG